MSTGLIKFHHKISACILVSVLVLGTFSTGTANAVESNAKTHTITLEEAQKTAIANTFSIKELDQQINHLLNSKDYNPSTYKGLKDNVQEEIDSLYLKMDSLHQISSLEMGILYGYYAMYGDTSYFKNKDVSKFFDPDNYPNYSLWSSLLKLEFNKKSIANTVSLNIREIYDNLLMLNGQLNILNVSLAEAQKNLVQEKTQYTQGKISKSSIGKTEQNIEIQKKQIDKLRRNIDNLEYDLKQLLGISFKDEIIVKEYDNKQPSELEDYNEYLNKALINRNDIAFARLDYRNSKNAYAAANHIYMDHMQIPEVILQRDEASNMLTETEESIKETKIKIQQEVLASYIDVKNKFAAIGKLTNTVKTKENNYKTAQIQFGKKIISKSQLDGILSDLNTEKFNYKNAVNEYNTAKIKLEYSCNVGPGY